MRTTKWLVVVVVGISGVALVGYGAWRGKPIQEIVIELPIVREMMEEGEGGEKDYDELSLPAIAAKEIVGGELTMGPKQFEDAVYTRYYITYVSQGLKISGIMNVPKSDGPKPVLILNHGFIDPAIYTNGRGLRREQDYLARLGFVVIHPDYRNHAQSDRDTTSYERLRLGYTEDVLGLIAAVKKANLAFIDKDRIGMMGHSMGGGVSLNVMVTKPDWVQAVVLYAPVSSDMRDNFDKWMRRGRPEAKTVIARYGDYAANPKFWDDVSPMNFFDRVVAPVLIFHGTSDDSVPIQWSKDTTQRLAKAGKEVEYVEFAGEEHEYGPKWTEFMQKTAAFFKKSLK